MLHAAIQWLEANVSVWALLRILDHIFDRILESHWRIPFLVSSGGIPMTWLAQKLSSRRRVLLTGALYGCAAIFLLSVVLGGQESNDEKPDDSGVTVKGNGNALINGNSNQINYNAVIPQATASPTVNGCVGMLFAGKMVGNDISDNTVTNC